MARQHRPPPRVDWTADDFEQDDVPELGFKSAEAEEDEATTALGSGRFSVVYHRRTPSGRDIALKRGTSTRTAQNEAKLLRDLHHPNIVRLMAVISEEDVGEEESQWGSVNLLQELVDMNLWQFIERRGRTELGWRLFLSMARDIFSAVAFLAANLIVHHDIKPHNLLVDRESRIKLCDFGNARRLTSADQVLKDGIGKGSTPYCAPEIFSRSGYTIKVDVYSAGVTLWVMLTGQPPFADENNNVVMITKIRSAVCLHSTGGFFPCPSVCLNGDRVADSFRPLLEALVAVDPAVRPFASAVVDQLSALA